MRRILFFIFTLLPALTHAQMPMTDDYSMQSGYDGMENSNGSISQGDKHVKWGRDTTENKSDKIVPIGVFQWTVDERLGHVIEAENNDTVVHQFQQYNLTEGYNGEYTSLGNLGSPRLSRIYMHRQASSPLIFTDQLDYFLGGLKDFRFSNTLSPITNLAYHKVGSSQKGQDRIRAYFASNINKISGIGFKLDYLYGRGYYNNQQNSQFGGTVFGYYRGERYNMHAWVNANHSKMAENGGLEDDKYITNPQSFPQRYTGRDIPTNLSDTWNRNDNQTYYLTHRYNLGFDREVELPDSLKGDSTMVAPMEFVPVSSIIHTLQIRNLHHTYYSNRDQSHYYTNHYYGSPDYIRDRAEVTTIRNTVGLAMREGFNKWAQMGITLFATHEYRHYQLPILTDIVDYKNYKENDILVGGEISREKGKFVHYNVLGEFCLIGNVGDFNVDGNLNLDFPLGKRDTVTLEAHGYVKTKTPEFFMRHYHSQFAWWDNDLDKEFKTRIEGTLGIKRTRTRLTFGIENVTKHTYFGMSNTLVGSDATSTTPTDYTHAVQVMQKNGSLQVMSATLAQDLKAGPLHLDLELTYQNSTDKDVLPLPAFNGYANLYLQFKIAKVLNVELGGDVRYFTNYYAPDYSALVGQFAVQDATCPRVKIGNYPVVNAYANLHIKHCRLYVMASHLNAGSGRMFWAPHYAIDPMTIHFGVSWNFFN